jgi:RNA-directed DNA polymerase
VHRIKTRIGEMLTPANMAPWPKVRQKLNRLLLGWSAYFGYGSLAKAYRDVDHYVVDHVRAFHLRRNKMQNRGTESFSRSSIYGELKVVALWKHHPNPTPIALP